MVTPSDFAVVTWEICPEMNTIARIMSMSLQAPVSSNEVREPVDILLMTPFYDTCS